VLQTVGIANSRYHQPGSTAAVGRYAAAKPGSNEQGGTRRCPQRRISNVHPSKGTAANAVYRKDQPNGIFDFKPDISHRYLAVRSGIGWFGLSGNVITKTHGASVVLGTTVTTAELEPTEPLPPEESYCNQCKLCFASCNSGLMDKK
jgi:epoxyqueuosine reductase QueG